MAFATTSNLASVADHLRAFAMHRQANIEKQRDGSNAQTVIVATG